VLRIGPPAPGVLKAGRAPKVDCMGAGLAFRGDAACGVWVLYAGATFCDLEE
jgi:hypothetical protein